MGNSIAFLVDFHLELLFLLRVLCVG